jgi:archaellum component FlaF (FlaF/FlaG flagellin family)
MVVRTLGVGVVVALCARARGAAAQPVLSLSASCTPDAQGTFTITNIGSNMTGPGTWTLLLDGTPIATNSFQLLAGASTSINTSGLFGTLELDASGGGAAPATVSTFCQSPPPPTLLLSATCTPDAQGKFTIKNIGSNMTGPGTWTLLLNGTPIATNSFQLLAGASTSINTSGLFGTLELDASGGGAAPEKVSTFCQGPTLSLSATCTPDSQGTFTITDIGPDMTGPGTWTVLLNGTPIATNTFQLKFGQSTNINTSGLFGTLELDTSGGGTAPEKASTFCPGPTAAAKFYALPPCRVVDTRRPDGPLGGPALQPSQVRLFTLAGSCGVPASALSVSVNVTAIPTAAGHFVLYPGNEPNPGTSNANFLAGQVRANNAVVPLATDRSGGLNVLNASTGASHVILDVNGYFQ